MSSAEPLIPVYPDNIRRDLRHVSGRIVRATNHRVLDRVRPVVQSAAVSAKDMLRRTGLAPANDGGRVPVLNSSNLLTATGVALGALVLVTAASRVRRP